MKFSIHRNIARLGVFSLGLVLWTAATKSLIKGGEFEREPNMLSLNGSPFGKTIAEKIRAQCKHAAVLMVRAAACVLGCPHPSHLVAASCEQVDGAKMHPTEDNLRLVPVLSSASVPAPTLSEPAATLETLELALGRGAFHHPKCPHVATRSLVPAACTRRCAAQRGRFRRALGRREQGLVQHKSPQLAREAHSTVACVGHSGCVICSGCRISERLINAAARETVVAAESVET